MQIEIYKNNKAPRDYFMSYVKKYIHFLFVITLCFNSLPLMSAEWVGFEGGYTPAVENIGEVGGGLSEIFSGGGSSLSMMVAEKPMPAVVISAALLLSAGLFAGRNKISTFAEKKANALKLSIEREMREEKRKFEECSWFNRQLLYLISPFEDGLRDHVNYGKWYATASVGIASFGWIVGFATWGGFLSAFPLIKAWMDRGQAKVHGKLDQMNVKLEKIGEDVKNIGTDISNLREEAKQDHQSTRNSVNQSKTEVLSKVDATTAGLGKHIETVKDEVNGRMQQLDENNNQRHKEAQIKLDKMGTSVEGMSQQLQAFESKTGKEMQSITEQLCGINNKSEASEQKMGSVLTQVDQIHTDLKPLVKAFKNNSSTLSQMDSDLKQLLRNNESAQKQFEIIASQYETTGMQLATHLSHVESIQADVKKMYAAFDRIEALESSVQTMSNVQAEFLIRLEQQNQNHKKEVEEERKKTDQIIAQLRKEREQDRVMFDSALGQIMTKLNGIEQQNNTTHDMMSNQSGVPLPLHYSVAQPILPSLPSGYFGTKHVNIDEAGNVIGRNQSLMNLPEKPFARTVSMMSFPPKLPNFLTHSDVNS